MKSILQLEETAQFALGIFIFSQLNFSWWYFPVFLLVPDLSMSGYLLNPKLGAWAYNFFHHKGLGILIGILGYLLKNEALILAGVILFSHSAFDRIMGYGLKFEDSFTHTHLGMIGKDKQKSLSAN
ncbi:protein of unknown function [Pseudarcicella hirudinis]|uniref:DUF4260 domain-containing protein n=1 Tax=Pseudarcicella hirudinis TaxID=1079859 RepID=A0A1I5Q8E7_9BACT|nr:DUF4260 domain-containing protein [Pseudarcicella hirudinis]SFP42584.1 protein of unknown function [Pseudarcicella hirudinis]